MPRLPTHLPSPPLLLSALGGLSGLFWSLTFGPWSTPMLALWGAATFAAGYLLTEFPSRRSSAFALGAAALTTAIVSTATTWWTSSASISGLDIALISVAKVAAEMAMLMMVALLLRAFIAATRHRQLGWKLAEALASENRLRARSMLMAERQSLAGEIHDTVGHRLAFTSLALGNLTTRPGLDEEARAELERIRGEIAESTDELGRTIALLRNSEPATSPADETIGDTVDRIRGEGIYLELRGDVPGGASTHVRSTLCRMLRECAANTAAHAAGAPLTAAITSDGAELHLRITTPLDDAARTDSPDRPESSGTGLASLAQRARILGGDLTYGRRTEAGAPVFRADLTLPVDAEPAASRGVVDSAVIQRKSAARQEMRRVVWTSLLGIGAFIVCAVVIVGSIFAVRTSYGVMSRADFDEIQPGMDSDAAEDVLPAVEMIEPPRSAESYAMDCRYYESRISWFERVDVFEVCFDGGHVHSANVIPATRTNER